MSTKRRRGVRYSSDTVPWDRYADTLQNMGMSYDVLDDLDDAGLAEMHDRLAFLSDQADYGFDLAEKVENLVNNSSEPGKRAFVCGLMSMHPTLLGLLFNMVAQAVDYHEGDGRVGFLTKHRVGELRQPLV